MVLSQGGEGIGRTLPVHRGIRAVRERRHACRAHRPQHGAPGQRSGSGFPTDSVIPIGYQEDISGIIVVRRRPGRQVRDRLRHDRHGNGHPPHRHAHRRAERAGEHAPHRRKRARVVLPPAAPVRRAGLDARAGSRRAAAEPAGTAAPPRHGRTARRRSPRPSWTHSHEARVRPPRAFEHPPRPALRADRRDPRLRRERDPLPLHGPDAVPRLPAKGARDLLRRAARSCSSPPTSWTRCASCSWSPSSRSGSPSCRPSTTAPWGRSSRTSPR